MSNRFVTIAGTFRTNVAVAEPPAARSPTVIGSAVAPVIREHEVVAQINWIPRHAKK
jgi:hypothetical protein